MTRKLLIVFLVTVIVLLMTSCEIDISKQIANEDQIFNDISDIESIKKCFKSDFVYESEYVCKDIEIVKRQTNKDEKEDFVFLTAIMQNDYFNVTLDLSLTYNFYDEGGWILDKNSWSIVEVKPIQTPEYDLITEAIISYDEDGYIYVEMPSSDVHYYVDSYNISYPSVEDCDDYIYLSESFSDSNGKYEYKCYAYYNVSFDYFDARLRSDLVFGDNGWELPKRRSELTLEKVISFMDTSLMNGKYQYDRPGTFGEGATLWIYNVDFENFTIECEYDFWSAHWPMGGDPFINRGDGDRKKVVFDPFNLTIEVKDLGHEVRSGDLHQNLKYIPSENYWKDYYMGSYFRESQWGEYFDKLLKT